MDWHNIYTHNHEWLCCCSGIVFKITSCLFHACHRRHKVLRYFLFSWAGPVTKGHLHQSPATEALWRWRDVSSITSRERPRPECLKCDDIFLWRELVTKKSAVEIKRALSESNRRRLAHICIHRRLLSLTQRIGKCHLNHWSAQLWRSRAVYTTVWRIFPRHSQFPVYWERVGEQYCNEWK